VSDFTPGPWEAREVSQSWIEILGNPDDQGSRQIVGTVLATEAGHSPEQRANARLIAKAPGMFAALEATVTRLSRSWLRRMIGV